MEAGMRLLPIVFSPFRRPRLRLLMAALSVTVLMAGLLSPLLAGASSHREAPLIAEDPLADGTDLYAFVSPDNPSTLTFVANYVPFQNPAGGPNFYRFGNDLLYQINIDNVGDAKAHIIFNFKFKTTTVDASSFLY